MAASATMTKFRACIYTVWLDAFTGSWPPSELPANIVYVNGQKETCPTSGKIHWQGYMLSDTRRSAKFFRKIFFDEMPRDAGAQVWIKGVNIDNGASAYGLKDETYCNDDSRFELGEKHTIKKGREKIITEEFHAEILKCETLHDALKLQGAHNCTAYVTKVWATRPTTTKRRAYTTCYPWQHDMINTLLDFSNPKDRTVHIIVDEVGGYGKTELSNILAENYNALVFNNGSDRDLSSAFASTYRPENCIVVIDLARASKMWLAPWLFMENLKNGRLTVEKYESRIFQFDPINVVVLCNTFCDFSEWLSADRLRVHVLSMKARSVPSLSQQAPGTNTETLVFGKPWPDLGAWTKSSTNCFSVANADDKQLLELPEAPAKEHTVDTHDYDSLDELLEGLDSPPSKRHAASPAEYCELCGDDLDECQCGDVDDLLLGFDTDSLF